VTETIVSVLKFEHRERAEILVQTALFFTLSIPFLSKFVSIVSVTTGTQRYCERLQELAQNVNGGLNGPWLGVEGHQMTPLVQELLLHDEKHLIKVARAATA
jgi:hypothetical protein